MSSNFLLFWPVVRLLIYIFFQDTIGPDVDFINPASRTGNSPTFDYSSRESVEFRCSFDDGDYKYCGRGFRGQWTRTNVPDGSHTLKVKGIDGLGVEGTPEVHTWIVGKY